MVPEIPGVCHDQRWGADGGFSFLHLTWFLLPRCTLSDEVWSACASFYLDPSCIGSVMHQVIGCTRGYSMPMLLAVFIHNVLLSLAPGQSTRLGMHLLSPLTAPHLTKEKEKSIILELH